MSSPANATWLEALAGHRVAATGPDSDLYWDRRCDAASADELRAMQDARVPLVVSYAYETIPFYRRKFDAAGIAPGDIRTVDDLRHVPVTTKAEMVADVAENPPWGTYTAVDDARWRQRGWQTFATSGTTGTPRLFRYTRLDRELWAWADARAMWAMGFRPGRDVALVAFGYGPHVWLWGVHYALNHLGIPIATAGGLDTSTRARLIEMARPTILLCTPSYALFLAREMQDMGIDPAASSIRYVCCAGEPGFSVPSTRERIEAVWGAEMHEFYGCTEASPAAGGYTCGIAAADHSGSAGPHLMEDIQYWEVVDPTTGARLGEGERGISVVTNLASEGSPQIRFVVGDYATLRRERCDCGRAHARAVGGFLGRADDMLNIRGVTLFPASVEDAVRRVPGTGDEFRIVVDREHDLDVLTVRVEPVADLPTDRYDSFASLVEREIRSRCELRPVVEIVVPGTLPRMQLKARRVEDRRP